MKVDQINEHRDVVVDDGAGFNVKDLLIKYYHYTWLFLLTLAVTLFCSWLYLRYTPSKYSVSATLLIGKSGGRAGGNTDMFSDLMLYRENTNNQNEIQILRSRKLMTRVVTKLGLQYSYYVVGNVKTTNIYKESPFQLQLIPPFDSSYALSLAVHFTGDLTYRLGENPQEYNFGQVITIGGRKIRLIRKESPYSQLEYKDYIVNYEPAQRAAMSVLGGLDVVRSDDLSNVLKLTYVSENPKIGADVINTLMEEYNLSGVEHKNQINKNILSFIDDRLVFVEQQLDSVERDMQRYKTNRQVIDLSTQSSVYFNNMTELSKDIRQEEVQLQVLDLLECYLRNADNKLELVPSTLGITDATLQALTTSYNDLVVKRNQELQTGATENSPVVKNRDQEIEQARQKLLSNLANIKTTYQQLIGTLNSQNSEYQRELAALPEKERESRERQRQQEIKQNLYLYLLQKKEESGIAQASVIADSRVIDEALHLGNRVSPNPSRVRLIAIFAGLILPLVIIYLLDLLNDKVTTKADITKVTNIPIVAEVGHNRESSTLLFPKKSRTVVAEQIRILRSNLRYLMLDKPDKHTILVTSSFSGEGKSFISTNLGAALALSGKRTVILEFDLRKPKILTGLELPRGEGLTNYLVGNPALEKMVIRVPAIENLYVLPSGPIPPNPSEMLLSERMPKLFEWLHQNFDAVVIDTAPVGLVSDSLTLSQYADATLYLVRQRYTNKKQLQFIQDLYDLKKLPHMGLVINDVVTEGTRGYYGYGSGRYGYGYGYGYGAGNGYYEEERGSLLNKWKSRFFRKKAKA